MARSQRQDAVLKERFWFRQDILARDTDTGDDSIEMTIDEIINGKVGHVHDLATIDEITNGKVGHVYDLAPTNQCQQTTYAS